MRYQTIDYDLSGGVAVITMNRPDKMNAMNQALGDALEAAVVRAVKDPDVRAIIVTGEGRAFCAGADLEPGGDTFARERAWQAAADLEARVRPWNLSTPIIAAINGPAVGIGATLPLHWDLRIASERAKIGFVFTRRGILPEANSTWILPRLVGLAKAMDLLLTGRILSAAEALEHGVVSRVVPHDELMASARKMAEDIARNTAPLSVAITKRLLWRQLSETDPVRAKALEDALFDWIGKQPDAAEGVLSFLGKRDPRWTGTAPDGLPPEIE